MKCPYCAKEMEKGYIEQTDFRFPLEWYPAERETGFLQGRKGRVKLTSAMAGGVLTAFRCGECKKFMIDQETLEV